MLQAWKMPVKQFAENSQLETIKKGLTDPEDHSSRRDDFDHRDYVGLRLSEKIGNKSDSPIPPTTNPIIVIIKGSIRLVAVLSDISTSWS